MKVLLQGQIVPEEAAVVSVFDRGFLYGDGLFETVRIKNGKMFRWPKHWARLVRGADFLKLRLPYPADQLAKWGHELARGNGLSDCLLRVNLSRGAGPRGYSPRGASRPTLVMTTHPVAEADPQEPPTWRLVTSSLRLPAGDPLAHFKTCNKLTQILARSEADATGANESLLLNTNGHVVEGSSSNLFWIQKQKMCTPRIEAGILPGVTREVVFEIARNLGYETAEAEITPQQLIKAEGIFLSVTSAGIIECERLDGAELRRSPLCRELQIAYWELLETETVD
jgi:branched-chain amino acid aminotransferase